VKYTVWVGETGKFLLKLLVDCATLIISWMVAATDDTSDIFRSILSVPELGGVGTGAFDASRFEMAIILSVRIVGSWLIGLFPVCV
jgi:hypothetical protein